MIKSEDLNKIYKGSIVAKNTFYNLIGYGIPLIVAVVLIPSLIKGLGEERFGILNLVWIVIGYFSFFDFGIGKTLTKIIAEKIGENKTEEIPGIFWTSIFLMLAISFLGTLFLIILIPFLVTNFFNISSYLQKETLETFYALAISIPIIITTTGLRGILEAYQKFGIINIIRIILGTFTFLGPLLCLIFTNSLFWIVIFLIFIRIVIWGLYLSQCFRIDINIKKEFKFNSILVKPVLKLGGWITVANIVGPFIIYLDRFLIGSLVSAAAITYYATPYEVVTKLLLIPGALVGVLFPIFSASFNTNPDFSKLLFLRGIKYIFLLLYPLVLIIITFAYEGMNFWLGEKFAENSSIILQLLAVGVLLIGVASIPFNFFQGIGRPDIPAKINLAELPPYLLLMWLFILEMGIIGAAVVWLIRIIIDTLILIILSNKTIKNMFKSKFVIFSLIIMNSTLTFPFFISDILLKTIFVVITLLIFSFFTWKYFLKSEEKIFLISKLKMIRN